jgi:phosphohistidine swiveling domain-containing protein
MSIEQSLSSALLVLPLDAPEATPELVGGKGASLARMAAAGLPVPSGFHVTTTAYRRFVTANGLQEVITTAASAANADNPAALEEASARIMGCFVDGIMPDEIAAAIRQAYAKLGRDKLAVAVRSSATAEDLPGMSFAGQQETYLNMRGEAMVLEAVKRCWASLWTARAIGYRAHHGLAPEDVSLAVVVQELVPADAAGILFTANPLTGARDQVMMNAAWGLGEAIVGGQVTPDMVIVDKASGTIISQEITEKDVMTVRTPEGTQEEPVPVDERTKAVLTSEQAAELARIGVQIEQLYGQPMDIEWAMRDGRVFVVQARPITALPEPVTSAATNIEWTTPKPKGSYWRSSVIELLPDPLSPLFATLGLPAWNRAMTVFVEELWPEARAIISDTTLITINGYAYYDFSLTLARSIQSIRFILMIPSLFSSMPRLLGSAQRRWGQEAHPKYAEVVNRWEATDLHEATATQLLDGAREIVTAAAEHYLTIQSGILPAAYISEMLFTIAYNRLMKRRNDPPALTFLLGYDSVPIQVEKSLYDLAQWAREQPGLAATLLHMSNDQFAAATHSPQSPQTASQTTQVEGVDEAVWSEFRKRFAAHLARFGHTIYDLDFAKAVPADDPTSLLETLKFFLSGEAPDPRARQQAAAAAREQATQMMLARLDRAGGPHLRLVRRLVRWAQRFAPLREDALADVGLGWPVLRRMLREIGRRLVLVHVIDTADDIFWLKEDEVQAAARAIDNGQPAEDYRADVVKRRTTWERERKVTPPVTLPLKDGARFLGIDLSNVVPARTGQQAGDVIKGIGASPGRITGPARVITGPDEFDRMRRGDILVAKITTPAWTPLFALAAGVVTDVGGPLSHSSIVAREYHIPAVLGTGVATERIRSGQRVTVDGDAGTVKLS